MSLENDIAFIARMQLFETLGGAGIPTWLFEVVYKDPKRQSEWVPRSLAEQLPEFEEFMSQAEFTSDSEREFKIGDEIYPDLDWFEKMLERCTINSQEASLRRRPSAVEVVDYGEDETGAQSTQLRPRRNMDPYVSKYELRMREQLMERMRQTAKPKAGTSEPSRKKQPKNKRAKNMTKPKVVNPRAYRRPSGASDTEPSSSEQDEGDDGSESDQPSFVARRGHAPKSTKIPSASATPNKKRRVRGPPRSPSSKSSSSSDSETPQPRAAPASSSPSSPAKNLPPVRELAESLRARTGDAIRKVTGQNDKRSTLLVQREEKLLSYSRTGKFRPVDELSSSNRGGGDRMDYDDPFSLGDDFYVNDVQVDVPVPEPASPPPPAELDDYVDSDMEGVAGPASQTIFGSPQGPLGEQRSPVNASEGKWSKRPVVERAPVEYESWADAQARLSAFKTVKTEPAEDVEMLPPEKCVFTLHNPFSPYQPLEIQLTNAGRELLELFTGVRDVNIKEELFTFNAIGKMVDGLFNHGGISAILSCESNHSEGLKALERTLRRAKSFAMAVVREQPVVFISSASMDACHELSASRSHVGIKEKVLVLKVWQKQTAREWRQLNAAS